MSIGAFSVASYEADSGETHPIRVQPESIGDTNPQGAAIVSSIKFRRGGSRRRYGNFARFITLGRLIGATGADSASYSAGTVYAKVTVFTKDAYEQLVVGAAYAYGGKSDWTIRTKTDERAV